MDRHIHCLRNTFFKKIVFLFFIGLSTFQFASFCKVEAQTTDTKIIELGTQRLQAVHSHLQLKYGNFGEEYPEQLMTAMYLSPDAKVLELGGNVGRNSCVIGALLNDSANLVSVESCEGYSKLLQENRDINDLRFHIEASAISKVPLIQLDWNTIPSEVDVPGWARVKTITFDEVQRKYGIIFDTLVVDCEGALFYMLRDDPDILRNMSTIIIENDFTDLQQMQFVHSLFVRYGLQCVYNQPGGWGPCFGNFYQVWKR